VGRLELGREHYVRMFYGIKIPVNHLIDDNTDPEVTKEFLDLLYG